MAKRGERRVFFPWERKRGLFGFVSRARARIVVALVLAITLIAFLRSREEHAASVRATRAAIMTAERAVMSYRADHPADPHACPKWDELVANGYSYDIPLDAWGRPLRLTCPGRVDPRGFDLASDGPDGLPGGLDRVE